MQRHGTEMLSFNPFAVVITSTTSSKSIQCFCWAKEIYVAQDERGDRSCHRQVKNIMPPAVETEMYIQYMSVCQSRCNVYSNNTEVSSDLSNFVGSRLCWCISSKAFWSRSTRLRPIQNVFLHSSCFLLMLQRSTIIKFRNIDSHTPTINELYITQPERDRASPVLSNEYFQLVVQNQRISALCYIHCQVWVDDRDYWLCGRWVC